MREYVVKAPHELTKSERAAWISLRAENPALYSPYFHPAYTEKLARLRPDVYVLVATDNTTPFAFLPFQSLNAKGFGRPVGAPLTDYHGFICKADADFNPADLLRETGLGVFHFSTLIDTNSKMSAYMLETTECTMMDIKDGADVWRETRDGSYRRHLKSHRRRVRKSEEEIGARRFEFSSSDPEVFETLIRWKREKFEETGKYDVLSVDWTLGFLKQLWEDQDSELRTEMHALYFGDRLAAIDLGLTDGVTFHSWIVAYENEFSTFAPGIQLLEGLIDEAQNLGIKRIDLGSGTDGYKRQYATESVHVGSGFVAVKGPAAALSKFYAAAENLGKNLSEDAPIASLGKIPGKLRRRYSQIAACEDSFSGRAKAMFSAVKTHSKSDMPKSETG